MEYTLKELEEWNVKIEKKATEYGLDYYPQEFEIVGFNEMLAYEAYGTKDLKPINVKKEHPEIYRMFENALD